MDICKDHKDESNMLEKSGLSKSEYDAMITEKSSTPPNLPKVPAKTLHRDIDGGWAWVVFFMSFVTRVLMGGMFWAINSYFVVFHEEFGETRSFTAAIGSVTFATFHVTAPVSSMMIQRYGVRTTFIIGGLLAASNYLLNSFATSVLYLIFTHGILLGVGFSFISNSSLVSLSQYFHRYANLATGVSMAGSGVGMFIFAQLIPHLLESYGWRGSMYLLSGLALQFCVCGSVLYSLETPNPEQPPRPKPKPFDTAQVKELFSSSVFWCLNGSQLFCAVSTVTIMVLYKDIALVYDMGDIFAWSLTVFGAGDIVGRTIIGFITNHPKAHPTVAYTVINLFCATVVTLHVFAITGPTSFLILGFFMGAAIGTQITLLGIVCLAMFGRGKFILVLGLAQFTAGFGALLGPPITGFLTDMTKSYSSGLGFVAVMNVIAAIFAYVSFRLWKRIPTPEKQNEMALLTVESIKIENSDFILITDKKDVILA